MAEASKASLHRILNMCNGRGLRHWGRFQRPADLSSQDNFVSPCPYSLAHDLFGPTPSIDVGDVEVIAAGVKIGIDQSASLIRYSAITLLAENHGAETEFRHQQSRVSKPAVLHLRPDWFKP